MKKEQLAAQLYTVRAHTQTPQDFADTLKKVKDIGYPAVEISGHAPIADAELAKILSGEGLVCCSSHESGEDLFNRPEAVIARMNELGCKTATFPWPGGIRFDTLEDITAFASQLEQAGRTLKSAGIGFCYHNHHMEFRRIGNRTVMEILFDAVPSDFMSAELDTYWIQFGGGNPVAWCERMSGRLGLLHMKDYVINEQNEVMFAEVGSGNLDWPAIVKAADSAGCNWFVPEQDETAGDPFDSLRKSYDYICESLMQ